MVTSGPLDVSRRFLSPILTHVEACHNPGAQIFPTHFGQTSNDWAEGHILHRVGGRASSQNVLVRVFPGMAMGGEQGPTSVTDGRPGFCAPIAYRDNVS